MPKLSFGVAIPFAVAVSVLTFLVVGQINLLFWFFGPGVVGTLPLFFLPQTALQKAVIATGYIFAAAVVTLVVTLFLLQFHCNPCL